MLKVGGYGPTWPDVHTSPEEAVQMHGELSGKVMLPMHWGTFNLAFHAWDEPAERTFAAAGAARLLTPVPGERIEPAACAPPVARRGLGSALTKGWGFAAAQERG